MTDGRFTTWDALPEERFRPTVAVRAVNGETCQLCRFTVEPGTPQMPPIVHEAEQLTVMVDGRQVVRLGDVRQPVDGGALWFIPSRIEHESELLELPSSVLDFHVPHRPEFVPGGREPDPGPEPQRPPRFSSWDDEPARQIADGVEVRVLAGERAELRRVTAAAAGSSLPDGGDGGERIAMLVGGRLAVRVGHDRADVGPGSVWVVPAGDEQAAEVLDGPVELLEFYDVRHRGRGAEVA